MLRSTNPAAGNGKKQAWIKYEHLTRRTPRRKVKWMTGWTHGWSSNSSIREVPEWLFASAAAAAQANKTHLFSYYAMSMLVFVCLSCCCCLSVLHAWRRILICFVCIIDIPQFRTFRSHTIKGYIILPRASHVRYTWYFFGFPRV